MLFIAAFGQSLFEIHIKKTGHQHRNAEQRWREQNGKGIHLTAGALAISSVLRPLSEVEPSQKFMT